MIDVKNVTIQRGSIIGTVQQIGGPFDISPSVGKILDLENKERLDSPEKIKQFSERLNRMKDQAKELSLKWEREGATVAGYGAARSGPTFISQLGLGETIKDALDQGYRDFIIGIGGSATNDGGVGMAQALGGLFLDSYGKQIPYGSEGLSKLVKIDLNNLDNRIEEAKFLVASDVTNPLLGKLGASTVYGPQKGATKDMIPILEDTMINYVKVAKKSLKLDVSEIPGSGAAGGLGAGLMMFLNAELKSGVDIILDKINFNKYLNNIDLVITGEGQMDYQTVYNKAPYGVALRAKKHDIPVIAISGSLGEDFQNVNDYGIDAVTSISQGAMNLDELTASVSRLIIESTEQVMRFIKVGSKLDFN